MSAWPSTGSQAAETPSSLQSLLHIGSAVMRLGGGEMLRGGETRVNEMSRGRAAGNVTIVGVEALPAAPSVPGVGAANDTSRAIFECSRCGKAYMSKGNLTRHLRFECGQQPRFSCPICAQRFKHKSSLRSHLAHIHHQP